MTTLVSFVPSFTAAFSFQPTLDGQQYNCVITWNIFGQRYYLNVYTLAGILVLCTALVGSPPGLPLESLTWANGYVYGTTQTPHGYNTGATIALTIAGASPSGYNGDFDVLITGPATFSYALAANPLGAATVPGEAYYDISLIAPLFASTLIYRPSSGQFEISP